MSDNETILKIKDVLRTLGVDFVKVKPWNEKTFKVEISSEIFEGIRRLDRFALLDKVLTEKLPEIFSTHSFLYKPFTKKEWEVRNQRKLEE
jgi:stress-induced morphogen